MYAVIRTGGKQYKVQEGDVIKIERLATEVGKKVEFEDVLMVRPDDEKKIKLGTPNVKNARVVGHIVKQGKDRKVAVYTFKRRKREECRMGHRQLITEVMIDGIRTSKPREKKKVAEEEENKDGA